VEADRAEDSSHVISSLSDIDMCGADVVLCLTGGELEGEDVGEVRDLGEEERRGMSRGSAGTKVVD